MRRSSISLFPAGPYDWQELHYGFLEELQDLCTRRNSWKVGSLSVVLIAEIEDLIDRFDDLERRMIQTRYVQAGLNPHEVKSLYGK